MCSTGPSPTRYAIDLSFFVLFVASRISYYDTNHTCIQTIYVYVMVVALWLVACLVPGRYLILGGAIICVLDHHIIYR